MLPVARIARVSHNGEINWCLVDTERDTLQRIEGDFLSWAPGISGPDSDPGRSLTVSDVEIPLSDCRLLPPVEKTNKIEVVGANYNKHLEELSLESAGQPVVFLKAYGALIGAQDPIRYPNNTSQLDYEVELVVVVGKPLSDQEDPLSSVLGYTVGNDVSARDLQMMGPRDISMDLFGAKSQDQTSGVGPWIVTLDEFPVAQPELDMRTRVNGELLQDGNSREMAWSIRDLLTFTNNRSTLEPGDVIFTGTPDGVGHSSGRYLQRGDIVEAEIEGIGTLRNRVS